MGTVSYEKEIFLLRQLSSSLILQPEENVLEKLIEIRDVLTLLPKEIVKDHSKLLLGAFYFYIKPSESLRTNQEIKENLVITLTLLLEKSTIDNVNVYRNINGYLLHEIYDAEKDSKIKEVSEEYKLCIVNCIKNLHDSISLEIIKNVYNREFIVVLSSLVYVCLGLVQREKLRSLRLTSMECIMSVSKLSEMLNQEIQHIVADVFMHFYPGLCRVLTNVALEDQKTGHKVICIAVKCFGGITRLVMQDYNIKGRKPKVSDFKTETNKSEIIDSKWKSSDEVKNYLESANRDAIWFAKTDSRLIDTFKKLLKLCYHVHEKVQLEFVSICGEIIKSCYYAIPKTSIIILEALIMLSEDIDNTISKIAEDSLDYLKVLRKDDPEFYKRIFDDFEDNFFEAMNSIPSIFYSFDDAKKLSQVNLLCGYLKVFKEYKISTLLYNSVNLRHFMVCLLTICTVDKLNLRLFDEYTIQDFELCDLPKTSWKIYKYHSDPNISDRLRKLFRLLAAPEIIEDIYYYLTDIFEKERDYKKEATLLLNEIISQSSNNDLATALILTYTNEENLSMPITASKMTMLGEVHENVLQLCLQLEGVGKLALSINENSNKLLLKILYPIVEKAGSLNPLIRLAGLTCLSNISQACNFTSVTELINKNSDYFSYHVTRKLRNYENNRNVLDVYGVVMKHCSVEILNSVADILENVSRQSLAVLSDEDQIPFLRIYDVFLKCTMRWFNIKVILSPIKSKQEKLDELYRAKEELFENNRDFSDETTKQSVEETFKVEKPNLPVQIKLTILILKTSLNYLSCSSDDVKILVLEILKNGVEIIRDYEDELLPIVHKIWIPLQYRFGNSTKPLIFNLTFQLLVALARVSKDFIRKRTSEKALPVILNRLENLSRISYLKDRGSEYRTTQNYKLQVVLLENLDRLITDIEIVTEDLRNVFKVTELYLSDKQPLPLQNLCIQFYKTMLFYDPAITKKHLNTLTKDEYKKNVDNIYANKQ